MPPIYIPISRWHRRHRLSSNQRIGRIYEFIHTRTQQGRPPTPAEVARHENLSLRRTKFYIKLINERLRMRSAGIESIETIRAGKTLRYVYFKKPEPEVLKPIEPQQAKLAVTLSLRYDSLQPSRNLYAKGWVLVSASSFHDPQVLAAQSALRYGIERVFGQKILQEVDIGLDRGVEKYPTPKFLGYSHQPNGPWTPIDI